MNPIQPRSVIGFYAALSDLLSSNTPYNDEAASELLKLQTELGAKLNCNLSKASLFNARHQHGDVEAVLDSRDELTPLAVAAMRDLSPYRDEVQARRAFASMMRVADCSSVNDLFVSLISSRPLYPGGRKKLNGMTEVTLLVSSEDKLLSLLGLLGAGDKAAAHVLVAYGKGHPEPVEQAAFA